MKICARHRLQAGAGQQMPEVFMKLGIIAGTPVDTEMGSAYLEAHGCQTIARACSPSPEEQMRMQKLFPRELTERVILLCCEMIREGAQGIYVNCNSMSAAIDLAALREAVEPVPVVTPLDVYEEVAGRFRCLSIIAANGQSLAAIERIIAQHNPTCITFGAGLMQLVIAIEHRRKPEEIMSAIRLDALLSSFAASGSEALILGCTHFPYLAAQIRAVFDGAVIDPNFRMLELLQDKVAGLGEQAGL